MLATREQQPAAGYEIDDLVSLERGEVDRRIFSDPEIFEQEMKLIFARAWLFLCHATQIPNAGDFFESAMGRDNVLVVRQKDGSVKAMLNTCTHRGNAVCRAEEGNVKGFLCTYHGWSFGIDGKLNGVPGYREFYGPDFDKSKAGLAEVAQLDTYKGFIFATNDPAAPPLDEYLGATGKLSLDLVALRGDMEVVPGIQKFTINCNWKFAVDNLYDWYHPQVTHISAFQTGALGRPPAAAAAGAPPRQDNEGALDMSGVNMEDGANLNVPVAGINGRTFDQIVVLGEYGHGIGGPQVTSSGTSQEANAWRDRPEVIEGLGPVGIRVAGHPNVFPTTWVTFSGQVSLRIPRSPDSTEIWWFTFVDKNAPPPVRRQIVTMANRVFGPAGLLEQDDGENWAQATMQTAGEGSRRVPQRLIMGLGRGEVIKEHGLAYIETTTNEHAQLWTYYSWAQWMKGLDWDELAAVTEPPDLI